MLVPYFYLPIRVLRQLIFLAGFSEEDVREARAQFLAGHPHSASLRGGVTYSCHTLVLILRISDQEAQWRLEEEWINSTIEEGGQATEVRELESQRIAEFGSSQDFVYGMVMGFLLGVIMVFFLVRPAVVCG